MKIWLCREERDYFLYTGEKPKYSTDSCGKPCVWQTANFDEDDFIYVGKSVKGIELKEWTCVRVQIQEVNK